MRGLSRIRMTLVVACLTFGWDVAAAQKSTESKVSTAPVPLWRDSARYGGGPSVGPPPSDYDGTKPPSVWCLQTTRRAPGDFGVTGQSWMQASRAWLREVLSDTSSHGAVWRRVLGGAPRLAPSDTIVRVLDESTCRDVAELLNLEVLGWPVGPPPVVIFRVHDYLIAFPSNASRGEFGLAVGMSPRHKIQGIVTW